MESETYFQTNMEITNLPFIVWLLHHLFGGQILFKKLNFSKISCLVTNETHYPLLLTDKHYFNIFLM